MGGIETRDRPIVQQADAEEALHQGQPAGLTQARPVPRWLTAVWGVLGVLAGLEGLHELTGFGGHDLVDNWLHNGVMVAVTALCLGRAVYQPHGRPAWLAFGIGLAFWTLGDFTWTIAYGTDANPPYPTIADVLWLA